MCIRDRFVPADNGEIVTLVVRGHGSARHLGHRSERPRLVDPESGAATAAGWHRPSPHRASAARFRPRPPRLPSRRSTARASARPARRTRSGWRRSTRRDDAAITAAAPGRWRPPAAPAARSGRGRDAWLDCRTARTQVRPSASAGLGNPIGRRTSSRKSASSRRVTRCKGLVSRASRCTALPSRGQSCTACRQCTSSSAP